MEYRFVVVVAIFCFCGVGCEDVKKVESTSTERAENETEAAAMDFSTRKGRSSNMVYAELVSCAVRYDTACLVGAAEDFLDIKRHELLAQADAQVSRAAGRADPENSPSHLAATVEKLLSELSGLFKNGISGLFSGREAEDDDEIADADANSVDDEDEDKDKDSRDVGEERGKKKKKKKHHMKLKLFLIIAAIAAKISFLAHLLQTAFLFKLVLLGIGILGVSVAKLVILVKHGKQKTIYYENSHHDHHYEHEDDDWQHDDHHGWGRSFAQNLAYAKQLPAQ